MELLKPPTLPTERERERERVSEIKGKKQIQQQLHKAIAHYLKTYFDHQRTKKKTIRPGR